MECLLPYKCMVTVPHIMVGLERMLDYRGVGLERFHCTTTCFVPLIGLYKRVRRATYTHYTQICMNWGLYTPYTPSKRSGSLLT